MTMMTKETKGVNWGYYDKFESLINHYMPMRGEGDTMASQIVTSVNKLVYKWYNDGDVYDNSYSLQGWANDLSSYANWLAKYVPAIRPELFEIVNCWNDNDYEQLLKKVADIAFDFQMLAKYETEAKVGSIYDCDGPFKYVEEEEEDEWDGSWYDDEEEEDEDDY